MARLELVGAHLDAGEHGAAIEALRYLILARTSAAGPDDLPVLKYRDWLGRLFLDSG